MKVLLFLFLCGLACVGADGAEDLITTCGHANRMDKVSGENDNCPKAGRAAKIKKAIACRCGYETGVGCTAELKKCLCSNQTMTLDQGALFSTTEEKVQRCPPRFISPDCKKIEECKVIDFYQILTQKTTPDFDELMDRLPDPLKLALATRAAGLAFLGEKDGNGVEVYKRMERKHFVRALRALRKLTHFSYAVRSFFRDENECEPCEFPKCFLGRGLSMIRKCDEAAGEVPFTTTEIFQLAIGQLSMCPKCLPAPNVTTCDHRAPVCAAGQDAFVDVDSGCPVCRKEHGTRCPAATLNDLEPCADGIHPEKDADGCPTCEVQQDQCEPTLQANLQLCPAGLRPFKDPGSCDWNCRPPTREEIQHCRTADKKKECLKLYPDLRECEADENPERDWDRCCWSCRRKETADISPPCTEEKKKKCQERMPLCETVWEDPVFCTTADYTDDVDCKMRNRDDYCCDPCTPAETNAAPLDAAECMADLPDCPGGDDPMPVEWSVCPSCIKVDPCEAKDCVAGCHKEIADDGITEIGVCNERTGEMGFDLEGAASMLRPLLQMKLSVLKKFAQMILKQYCQTLEAQEKCKKTGMRVINSIETKILNFIGPDGTITSFGHGMTASEAMSYLPDGATGKIHCSFLFSIISSFSGQRRLLTADASEEGQLVKSAFESQAASGPGITLTATGENTVASCNPCHGDGEIADDLSSSTLTSTTLLTTAIAAAAMAMWAL